MEKLEELTKQVTDMERNQKKYNVDLAKYVQHGLIEDFLKALTE
jgi:hypothetical protein